MHGTGRALSRIGRTLISLDKETFINISSYSRPGAEGSLKVHSPLACTRKVVVKGKLDTLELPIQKFIDINVQDSKVAVKIQDENDPLQKAMWGTIRAHLNRMIQGVQDGYTLPIRMVGVGYRALMENEKLSLKIGVSHPVLIDIPQGVSVSIPAPQLIILQGADWAKITQFAAQIRKWRKPEPYNQKGIFVGDETIKKKEGKKR